MTSETTKEPDGVMEAVIEYGRRCGIAASSDPNLRMFKSGPKSDVAEARLAICRAAIQYRRDGVIASRMPGRTCHAPDDGPCSWLTPCAFHRELAALDALLAEKPAEG